MPKNNFINSILGTGDDEMEAIQKQDTLIKEYKKPNKDLQIFIPTYKRSKLQHTLYEIPQNLRSQTFLVIRPEEKEEFKSLNYDCNLHVLNSGVSNIRETRDEIFKIAVDRHVVLDDDLTFFKRKQHGDWHLRKMNDEMELNEFFYDLEQQLFMDPYVGVASREGFNQLPTNRELSLGKRMTRVHGYSKYLLKQEGVHELSSFELMEDFEFQLNLITQGIDPVMLLNWAHNQRGSGTTGGCSDYRTLEKQEYWAEQLAAKYPDFVKLVKKKTKTAWNGQERTDVVISWQKAYKQHS